MATLRRYARAPILGGGSQYGTSYLMPLLRDNIKNGNIRCDTIILQGLERLDTISARVYGNPSYYWLIAIASGIGWVPAVPASTILKIPNLSDCAKYIV